MISMIQFHWVENHVLLIDKCLKKLRWVWVTNVDFHISSTVPWSSCFLAVFNSNPRVLFQHFSKFLPPLDLISVMFKWVEYWNRSFKMHQYSMIIILVSKCGYSLPLITYSEILNWKSFLTHIKVLDFQLIL